MKKMEYDPVNYYSFINQVVNMPSVFKTTLPYMNDLQLYTACGGPLQLGVVLVVSYFWLYQLPHSLPITSNYLQA